MAGEAPRFLPPGSGVPVDGSEEAVNGMHAPIGWGLPQKSSVEGFWAGLLKEIGHNMFGWRGCAAPILRTQSLTVFLNSQANLPNSSLDVSCPIAGEVHKLANGEEYRNLANHSFDD
jgi:hypothetical protein